MKTLNLNKRKKIFKGYSPRDKRKFLFVFTFMAFPVLQVTIFYFFVNFYSFSLAFTNSDGSFGFGSFEKVFHAFRTGQDSMNFNPWDMVLKSIIHWLLTQGASIFWILSSYILTKHMIGARGFRLIYYISSIVGGVIMTAIMKEMFAYNGIYTELVKNLGLDLPARVFRSGLLGTKETAFPTIMSYKFIVALAGGGMIIASAYMRIPNEIFEASKIEGCGFWRETFQIALPCIWPTFSTLLLFQSQTIG